MTTKTKPFAHINQPLAERLRIFRRAYQPQRVQAGDHTWQYFVAGAADAEPLLLLPGGGGGAEAMFTYVDVLAQDFRVIVPDLPPTVHSLDAATQGLRVLLAQEAVEQVCVMGISLGGLLAQVFIRRFPDVVLDWVITHTILPSEHLAAAMRMQRNLMWLYPGALLRWMTTRAYRNQFQQTTTPASVATKNFWRDYFEALYARSVTRADWLARAHLTADYHTNHAFRSDDLKAWQGDMLIIESSDDAVVDAGDRGALKGMYPRAYVQTLWGYDHLAPILAADEIARSVQNFLLKDDLNES